jgi:hypothetical protein
MSASADADKAQVPVDADALREVLQALIGPPHQIRELQVLRGSRLPGLTPGPIDKLINQYNAWAKTQEPGSQAP